MRSHRIDLLWFGFQVSKKNTSWPTCHCTLFSMFAVQCRDSTQQEQRSFSFKIFSHCMFELPNNLNSTRSIAISLPSRFWFFPPSERVRFSGKKGVGDFTNWSMWNSREFFHLGIWTDELARHNVNWGVLVLVILILISLCEIQSRKLAL